MENSTRKEDITFFVKVSAPAQRALQREGILTEDDLAKFSKADILKLHGVGPGSIPKLEAALAEKGLSFKKE